jgi:hypothetical protein
MPMMLLFFTEQLNKTKKYSCKIGIFHLIITFLLLFSFIIMLNYYFIETEKMKAGYIYYVDPFLNFDNHHIEYILDYKRIVMHPMNPHWGNIRSISGKGESYMKKYYNRKEVNTMTKYYIDNLECTRDEYLIDYFRQKPNGFKKIKTNKKDGRL